MFVFYAKVMKDQSLSPSPNPKHNPDSHSDGDGTSGADFSDQRSEDEYCPCDACIRKKLAARPIKEQAVVVTAPVDRKSTRLKSSHANEFRMPSSA